MNLLKILTWLFLISILNITTASAANPTFLHNSPYYYFSKQDWALSQDASFKALGHAKDGQKMAWQNPKTGASGYSIPSQTKGSCRHLKIFNQAEGVSGSAEYTFCKMNGEWKIVH